MHERAELHADSLTRVLLVGRTGLDASLRRDRGLELVRVAHAVDAVAELACPMDDDADATVVVIAEDAEPGRDEPDPRLASDTMASFFDEARRAQPGVRFVRACANGSPPSTADRYDALVDPRWDAGRVRAALDAHESVAPAAATPVQAEPEPLMPTFGRAPTAQPPVQPPPQPPPQPPAQPPVQPAPVQQGFAEPRAIQPPGDDTLVRVVLAGEPIVPAALAVLRQRLGHDVTYLPAEDVPGEPPRRTAPVVAGGVVAGYLHGASATTDALAAHAEWLACWLALGRQHERLQQEAYTDSVTGAWNRRYFDRFLPAALEHTGAQRNSLTLMIFDVDDFKSYNDRFGHAEGDAILREVVALLASVVRPTDRICRVGGDEFAVVFFEPEGPREPTSQHPETPQGMAERFQHQLCTHQYPLLTSAARATLSVSGGLATFPWDGRTTEELVGAADRRVLESKRAGKNLITFGPGVLDRCPAPPADPRSETSSEPRREPRPGRLSDRRPGAPGQG